MTSKISHISADGLQNKIKKLTAIYLKVTVDVFPYATDYHISHLIPKSCQQCSHYEVSINALQFVTTA